MRSATSEFSSRTLGARSGARRRSSRRHPGLPGAHPCGRAATRDLRVQQLGREVQHRPHRAPGSGHQSRTVHRGGCGAACAARLFVLQKTPVDAINFAPYKFFGFRGSGFTWLSDRAAVLRHDKLTGKRADFWDLGSAAPWQFVAVPEIDRQLRLLAGGPLHREHGPPGPVRARHRGDRNRGAGSHRGRARVRKARCHRLRARGLEHLLAAHARVVRAAGGDPCIASALPGAIGHRSVSRHHETDRRRSVRRCTADVTGCS
jgi:hypothetical protein